MSTRMNTNAFNTLEAWAKESPKNRSASYHFERFINCNRVSWTCHLYIERGYNRERHVSFAPTKQDALELAAEGSLTNSLIYKPCRLRSDHSIRDYSMKIIDEYNSRKVFPRRDFIAPVSRSDISENVKVLMQRNREKPFEYASDEDDEETYALCPATKKKLDDEIEEYMRWR